MTTQDDNILLQQALARSARHYETLADDAQHLMYSEEPGSLRWLLVKEQRDMCTKQARDYKSCSRRIK